MKRRSLLKVGSAFISALILEKSLAAPVQGLGLLEPAYEPMHKGPFKPTWQSLKQYKVPDWYRDAKFGMWAHWGPQCQPEAGDWYAREMYMEGSRKYEFHVKKYGHPSKFGFKDVINEWKAEKWNPDELVTLYKNSGAQYFMALANHHDNLDLYDSKYQSDWNSTKVGPKKDIIGGWAKAAKKAGLPFGVSVHAAHTWSWLEVATRADKNGPYAGIPYDGNLTKKDGAGKWWNGLDPQALYEQNHPLSQNSDDDGAIHRQWNWGNGASVPSKAYCEKFYNRTIDDQERKIVEDIGVWMRANGESIYGTHPWKIFGEGPAQEGAAALTAQGFNEGKGKPFTDKDVRFVTKDNYLYATVMAWPETGTAVIKSLAAGNQYHTAKINRVELVATKEPLQFKQTAEGLVVTFPANRPEASYANALKIS